MKNIIKSALVLLCGICLFASCSDDNEHNPTLISPKTFVLNTPAYATSNIDMATSTQLTFTWQYPDYGFPAPVTYVLQYSVNGNFNKQFVDSISATEQSVDFINGDSIYTQTSGIITAAELSKKLQQIANYKEDAVPATQKVYIRGKAMLGGDTIYSNTITMNVAPYYFELKDAAPVIYYLIGGCIGDGKWTNGDAAIGTSMIPMQTIAGQSYDKKTGTGKIEYIGYFPANGEFKIIKTPGSWDYGFCKGEWKDDTYTPSYRDGGDDPGNIGLTDAGYYDIVVNTADNTCTIKKYTKTVNVIADMFITGDFDSWGLTTKMKAISTADGLENHDWAGSVTITANGGVKFTDTGWAHNWGTESFPYGTGVQGGGNIPATPGTYKVYLNDITGSYNFIAQ